jgi:hypothetical protein
MATGIKRRLQKLEDALTPPRSKFHVWDDGDEDIETKIQRERAERGLSNSSTAVIVSWQGPGELAQ